MNPFSFSISPSSSSSSSCKRKRNPNSSDEREPDCEKTNTDVFMNYSFEDIGSSFISHLQGALRRSSFTISDHTMLPVGQDERSELLKAIEESEIRVIVFSVNYAFSLRCLDELVDIMDCVGRFNGKKVFPIYYKVEPSDVRSQRGSFKEAFQVHEANVDPKRVHTWKKALKHAGQLSGSFLQNGDEEKFIRKIVKELVKMLNRQELHVAKHPVGIESRVEELISKLRLDGKGVLVVAVFGISGIGKTTIVKAVYNKIAVDFDVSCFLGDIHYHCGSPNWKVDLPKLLISCLTPESSIMGNHNEGVTKIKRLISRRKVLLVLDDVDTFQQLEALGIDLDWFYNGSRIIVTTRDRQSLGNIPYTSYNTMLLNRSESLKLFTGLMFARDNPVNTKFAKEIMGRDGGLSLVLKVRSNQFSQNEREHWPSILETLKRIPHGDFQKQLQMSYDSLPNMSKKIFLDIVCFFAGRENDLFDKQSLGYTRFASYNTMLLNRRESLNLFTRLTFLRDDHVNMMFIEEVVRHAGGLPLVLKVWSRHFKQYEKEHWPNILETLKRIPHCDVQKQLQMSYDSLPSRSKKLFLDIACFFDGMEEDLVVKVLQDEDLAFFSSNEIQYLIDKSLITTNPFYVCMHHAIREMGQEIVRQENEDDVGQRTRLWDDRDVLCVLTECSGTDAVESIRMTSYVPDQKREEVTVQVEALRKMRNLRFVRLCHNHVSWISSKDDMPPLSFKKLKYLEWFHFPFKCINNIDMANLVVLRLYESNLEILWEGIKSLKKLRILDVSRSSLLIKTGDFYGLDNLEELHVEGCENLQELHNSIGCLHRLVVLNASTCTGATVLSSETRVKLLQHRELKLDDDLNTELELDDVISSWREFRFSIPLAFPCNMLKIPGEIGRLTRLKKLDLRENGFPSLPDSLSQLNALEKIELFHCTNLKSIPNLPPNITDVGANFCRSLVNLPSNMSELKFLERLLLDGCSKLGSESLMKITGVRSLRDLRMEYCNVSQVPSEIGNLVSLNRLDLSGNSFSSLPDSFSNLSRLNDLRINDCNRLELFPLLPSNLTNIQARDCCSLIWMPFDLNERAYCFRTKLWKESSFTKPLEIHLSWEGVPEWCSSYGDTEHILSFKATDKKICGVILCATVKYSFNEPQSIKVLNKNKKTSCWIRSMIVSRANSMYVLFYGFNDTTIVVEAGDIVMIQFVQKITRDMCWRYGFRLMYERDVVDSKLLLQSVIESPDVPS